METTSKNNKLVEFKKVSLKGNTGPMPIMFYNELTKQLKKGKCYEIMKVKIAKNMTQSLLKTIEFTEISEIEDNSSQPSVVSVDLKILKAEVL